VFATSIELNSADIASTRPSSSSISRSLGLVPIAVFPPYTSARTLPAVSVIFAEDPNIMMLNDDVTVMRTRRAIVNIMKKKMQRKVSQRNLPLQKRLVIMRDAQKS
jgi:hypothetical protein